VHSIEKAQTLVPTSKAVCKGKPSQCLIGQPMIVELDGLVIATDADLKYSTD
jgi:hypothetical protein